MIEHIDRKAFGNLGNSIETILLKGNQLTSLQVIPSNSHFDTLPSIYFDQNYSSISILIFLMSGLPRQIKASIYFNEDGFWFHTEVNEVILTNIFECSYFEKLFL